MEILWQLAALSKGVQPTIFEISGYPHYENVISNILAFYLDESEAHGMSDLFLRSFFELLGEEPLAAEEVQTEVATRNNKRIDILVRGEGFALLIENKIFHELNNDLDEYARHIRRAKKKFLILLTLRPHGDVKGFVNITYRQLFGKIRKNLDDYNGKYLTYLEDLIETIEHLEEGTIMDEEFVNLLEEKEREVIEALDAVHDFKKELRDKVTSLNNFLEVEAVQKGVWRRQNKLFDISFIDIDAGRTIAVDSVITARGWKIELFDRDKEGEDITLFLEEKGIPSEFGPANRYPGDKDMKNIYPKRFKYSEDVSVVAEEVRGIIGSLTALSQ